MSINGIIQILLARRYFIAVCVASCLVGVIIVSLLLPPIWEAHAKVMLNLLRPDPVTSEVSTGSGGGGAGTYMSTQVSLITDYSVTGKAVDALGWLSDPDLIAQYQNRSPDDHRDFRSWAAAHIARNTTVKPVKDSTILDISYKANSPTAAKAVADATLKAYVETALAMRTEDAARTAAWYEGELQKLKTRLDDAVETETTYERQNHIAMANDKLDTQSARLQSLAGSGAPLVLPPAMVDAAKQSGMELATVNAQIVAASKTLGPNNPQMEELVKRKSELEALAAKDAAAVRAANAAAAEGAGNVDRQLARAETNVLANSEKIGRLQTLQQDVELRRNQYEVAAQKFAVYRAEADQTSANALTPLPAVAPDSPLFPNWMLEIPGSIVLGLLIGGLGAILMELFNRRVRTVEDLDDLAHLPVIGVIGYPGKPTTRRLARRPQRAAARTARA